MKKTANVSSKKSRPALSPEARENQMISYAMDLAEQQLKDGTASSQLITEFVKRGSTKARLENEILDKQRFLVEAKTEALKSQMKMEELFKNAMEVMKTYTGSEIPPEEDYD